ncbi:MULTISPECIES: hypothetical protein [Bacillus subtilis group]|uniref:hypothetical protein n=1 Tax=Bacillus subtilis group TaxID=653685 RepID=UPI00084A229A|nr:hypothetical protein [Bacillus subtilis]ODV48157.1 hypothetical protein BCM26_04205 [Bacillus subtilis]OJH64114.1 hypothetical protein BOH71_07200 [Bacillus subtilis]
MANTIKLTKNRKSSFYLIVALVGLTVGLFLFTSKITLWDDTPILQTEFNDKLQGLNNSSVVLKEWQYNPDKKLMEITIKAASVDGTPVNNLTFYAKEKQNPQKKIPVEVVTQYEDAYVLHIKNIQPDYQVVGVVIAENVDKSNLSVNQLTFSDTDNANVQEENDQRELSSVTIYGDYRKVKVNPNLKTLTKKEYEIRGIKEDISVNEKEKRKIDTTLPEQKEYIEQLNEEIKTIEKDKKYQTNEEQIESNATIKNKQEEIENVNLNIQKLKERSKEYGEKIEKLNLKLNDVQKNG